MLKLAAILVPLLVLGVVAPAGARPSNDPPGLETCEPTTSTAIVDLEGVYVVADLTGVYVYEENGVREGLQRRDRGHDDTCRGFFTADNAVL